MRVRNTLSWLVACVGLVACGGEEAPPPGTPAGGTPTPPPATSPATTATGGDEASAPAAAATEMQDQGNLSREVFNYRGAGRDPFVSLLKSGDVRPLPEDLRVTTINYDARYPGGSVAVLRDTTMQKRYTVRVGDEVIILRVTAIHTEEVLVTIEEFGVERQMSLRLRGRQEETP